MLLEQIIRVVIYSEITRDSFTLNISMISFKLNNRITKILYSNTITAKGALTIRMDALQPCQILLIQYKAFQLIPYLF